MDMENVSVTGFQKEYKAINLELKRKNLKLYESLIIAAYTFETKNGFIVKRVHNTTKAGTKITFKLCESQEEADIYSERVNIMVKLHNEKYKGKDV